jgi:hypothetical protein
VHYSTKMNDVWEERFGLIRAFGWFAVAGLLFGLVAAFTSEGRQLSMALLAALFFLPPFLYCFVIWHWKERYRGNHSSLWGAVILLEASGWLKLVYLLRHIIPDMRHTGRYRISL